MITRKQIGGVHISAALPSEAPKVVEIQAGCSYSTLTLAQLVQLRAALDKTITEAEAKA